MAVLILALGCSGAAEAQLWSFSEIKEDRKAFWGGLGGGILLHELGHVLVAEANDYDVSLDGLTVVYPGADLDNRDRMRLASAGFQVQWLVSEWMFRKIDNRQRMDNLSAGAVVAHLSITAAYLAFLKNEEGSDIAGIAEASGVSKSSAMALVMLPAILDGWRLLAEDVPSWVPRLSVASKGLMLGVFWTFE